MSDDARAAWLGSLDPGIAPYVDVLDAAGIPNQEEAAGRWLSSVPLAIGGSGRGPTRSTRSTR
jgi:hypothetical protein